jgi:hypothetical protein
VISRERVWAAKLAGPGYALALTVLVTAPLLRPGYLLLRDAVSTPRSYLTDDALGLSESAPRALPQDFAVALASRLTDGGVVVKVLLIAGLWLAGWGAARLAALVLPESGLPGQFVAGTIAIWNPYVAERLLQGHWSLIVGYGCLPWLAATMIRLRTGDQRWWTGVLGLAFWIALAGLTPTGLMLAATVALTCAAVPGTGASRWLCASASLGLAVLAALPWLAAAALGGSMSSPQAPGVAAFAARAEPGLGTLGSLVSLGGIWNAESVPSSRTTLFAVVGAVVLLGVVALGVPALLRRPPAVALLVLAAVAVLIPAVMATGPGLAAVRGIVQAVPALGVVRDAQKWVALAIPAYALAGAGAVLTLRRMLNRRGVAQQRDLRAPLAALACCLALVVVLPDLAWGVGGKVGSVRYPRGWAAVAAAVNADPGPVALLPAGTMRRFGWSGPSPVLDPLPRWVVPEVLTTGDLTISGRLVPGEGSHARAVQRLLLDGADPPALSRAGVRWVVMESGTGGETGSATRTLDRIPVAYRDGDLTLYRAGGDAPGASAERRRLLIAAHLVWLGVLAAGAAGLAVAANRGPRSSDHAADAPAGAH